MYKLSVRDVVEGSTENRMSISTTCDETRLERIISQTASYFIGFKDREKLQNKLSEFLFSRNNSFHFECNSVKSTKTKLNYIVDIQCV